MRRIVAVAGTVLLVGCIQIDTGGTSSSSSGTAATSDGGTATSSARVALDVTSLCARLIGECGQALDAATCQRDYLPLRVTSACAALVASGSCADLTSTTSTLTTTCFPPCTGTLASCNGDGTISVCSETGLQNVLDCAASCTVQGAAGYTGTCGSAYAGRTSDHDQCWCK